MEVKFKKGTTSEINNMSIENGSILFDTEAKKIYLDENDSRISMVDFSENVVCITTEDLGSQPVYTIPFPTGYTKDNCVLIGLEFYDNGMWRTDFDFATSTEEAKNIAFASYLDDSGIGIAAPYYLLASKTAKFKIVLLKTS